MKLMLDSNVIVWGIKKEEDPDKVKEAETFFKFVDGKKYDLFLSTPVLAEILAPYQESDEIYQETVREVSKRFIILPFNYQSAVIAAGLINSYKNDPELQKIKQQLKENGQHGKPGLKAKIKFDIQIVAIALAHKMDLIVTDENNDVVKYAAVGGIPAKKMYDVVYGMQVQGL